MPNKRHKMECSSILGKILQAKNREHNIIIYNDVDELGQLYAPMCKKLLEDRNEIVIFLTHYETVETVASAIKKIGVDTEKYEEEHSLIIMDSAMGFFDSENVTDIADVTEFMAKHIKNLNKNGISLIADMGPFFYYRNKNKELLHYEKSLAEKKKKNDGPIRTTAAVAAVAYSKNDNKNNTRGISSSYCWNASSDHYSEFCFYNKKDFDKLSESLGEKVIMSHNRYYII